MRKPLRLYSRMPLRMLPLTLRHRDVLEALTQSTTMIILLNLIYIPDQRSSNASAVVGSQVILSDVETT